MKTSTKNSIIGGLFVVVSAIIGIFSYNIKSSDNTLAEYGQLQKTYNELENRYLTLEQQNNSLLEENVSLQNEILNLKSEIEIIKNNIADQAYTGIESYNDDSNTSSKDNGISLEKVSIFDLDTFQGKAYWFDNSYIVTSKEDLIDTYGNEYFKGHYASHGVKTKDSMTVPTYLLDFKYSKCEGKIAWSKTSKNNECSCWIDFYSGDNLIYTTDIITATDRPLSFEFSVEGLETLTIVCNGNSSRSTTIIYEYLNLIP